MLISPSFSQANQCPAIKPFERPLFQNSIEGQDTLHFEGRGIQKTVRSTVRRDRQTGEKIGTPLTGAQKNARSYKKSARKASFLIEMDEKTGQVRLTEDPKLPDGFKSVTTRNSKKIIDDNKGFLKPEYKDEYDRITGSPTPEPQASSSQQPLQFMPLAAQQPHLPSIQPSNQFPQPYFPLQQPALPQPEFVTHTVSDRQWQGFYRNVYNSGRMSPNPRPYRQQAPAPAYFPFQGGYNQ